MTQRNNSDKHLQHRWLSTRRFASTLPAQSLCWLSSFSLLSSGGLVFAQTESAIDNIVPTVENSQPAPVANTVKKDTTERNQSASAPVFSLRRARLRQKLARVKAPEPTVVLRRSRPQVEVTQPRVVLRRSRPQVEATQPTASVRKLRARVKQQRSTPVIVREEKPQQESQQRHYSSAPGASKDYNNAYIDPTDYSVGATDKYEAPNSVVIAERSSGCRTILSQGVSSLCAKPPLTPYKNQRLADADTNNKQTPPTWLRRSQPTKIATIPPVRRVTYSGENTTQIRPTPRITYSGGHNTQMRPTPRIGYSGVAKSAYRPNRFIPNNFTNTTTVSSTPIAPTGGALSAPMTADNIAPRPSTVTYDIPLAYSLPQIAYGARVASSGTGLMFPLSVPASITSLFGWRTHPITGDRRFHSGIDIGAAMGTPILAVYSGQVEIADYLGGYGLAVILNHNNAQQTLYGHMSELFVQPGQWVEQGAVIGRVGSTGNSTGPHLHFEVRHLTAEGWVATDPGVQLDYAQSQLLQSFQTAPVREQPGS